MTTLQAYITLYNENMTEPWKNSQATRPLRSLWYVHIVIKCNIRGAKPRSSANSNYGVVTTEAFSPKVWARSSRKTWVTNKGETLP